ncbi:MAG: DUF3237 domain-containing protein [Pirellulaceae bacterium]
MKLKPLMHAHFDLREPFNVGCGPFGKRVVYDVTGGTFEGDRLRGTALPSGGDWVLFDADGVARLDVRVTLKTHDGALIYVHYDGIVVPNDSFNAAIAQGRFTEYGDAQFMTRPHLETGDERYRWVNLLVAVAEGRASAKAVEYRMFELEH